MASVGPSTMVFRPLLVSNPQHISIGAGTTIRDMARLEVVIRPNVDLSPNLKIGSNVNIEQGAHIICQTEVVIEDNVSITPYCVIVDTDHPFDPPDQPPKIGARLTSRTDTRVRIGEGSFIGAHSVILPGVEIGKGCIVGAGSVVSRSVPDYCIVSGAPARIRQQFDTNSRTWHKDATTGQG